MKRAPGEDFEEYRQRRKEGNVFKKTIGRFGTWFHKGTYRKEPVVPGPKRTVVSAAAGKRHKNESLEHFKARRRACNARRRKRKVLKCR